ncbi:MULTISPECIES: glycoside hydrolase family 16 protein [Lysobacter]|uniref:Glycoside hydrolase-16 family protein n=1 Tax=Lysobacter gummosus TaxID=262324 RepID=W0C3Y1_9GAMM|nr:MULTISPECIES: glycoside hydrolase family 16 protein [Lysobacter]AHE78434.1 glycoside hydrolase-16 family protein [Lysobacter gummosus]UJB20142.1 glycoside hydrolase family 16 protein [Lysobacter capsici]UJQ30743.1 glycoside hydrolase family 16 protein [Lysobacter gummosus]
MTAPFSQRRRVSARRALLTLALGVELLACIGLAQATPPGTIDYENVGGTPLRAIGRDIQAPVANTSVLFGAQLLNPQPVTYDQVVFAVRDASDRNFDLGHQNNYTVGTTQRELTASGQFPAGQYRYWLSYYAGGQWTNLAPERSFTVAAAPPGGDPVDSRPLGAGSNWVYKFGDEFTAAAVDWNKWADNSSAESDNGHGNPGNQQLEWNQAANCSVSNGVLAMQAKRERVRSPSGRYYDWTSCLLSSHKRYNFRYGFIEARMKLPGVAGFWPAFWTFQAPGAQQWNETDVFEYYSDNKSRLYLNQYVIKNGAEDLDSYIHTISFDPSAGYHVYGADIAPDATRFYVDGQLVRTTRNISQIETSILVDHFVYAGKPPASTTQSATTYVDYIRAWQRP